MVSHCPSPGSSGHDPQAVPEIRASKTKKQPSPPACSSKKPSGRSCLPRKVRIHSSRHVGSLPDSLASDKVVRSLKGSCPSGSAYAQGSRGDPGKVNPPDLPLAMVEYFPSKGDLPPLKTSFPPPPQKEKLRPPLLVSPSLPGPRSLDQSLSMRDRWESLRGSISNKPDRVAVSMAIDGLKISWSLKPPMSFKWDPPAAMVTSAGNTIALAPKVQDWLERGIVTDDCSLIPDRVHFGRLFYVPKKDGGIQPILDLSYLNIFIKTPKLTMDFL